MKNNIIGRLFAPNQHQRRTENRAPLMLMPESSIILPLPLP